MRGEGFFRGVFLFPMAISFIATAIVWRWLLNNATGSQETGFNKLFKAVGLDFLANDWFKSNRNWAVAAIALPAGWALCGYVMALFLAGMRGVSDDLREAARVDGASEPKVFWYVVRPMLLPVVMSAVVILAHISLKTFDLMFAMDVESRKIETPALYMWFTTFDGLNFSRGAAIATLLVRRHRRGHRPVHLVLDPRSGADERARRRSPHPLHWARYARRRSLPALVALVLLFLMPVYVLLVTAFKDPTEVSPSQMWTLPDSLSLDTFREVWPVMRGRASATAS